MTQTIFLVTKKEKKKLRMTRFNERSKTLSFDESKLSIVQWLHKQKPFESSGKSWSNRVKSTFCTVSSVLRKVQIILVVLCWDGVKRILNRKKRQKLKRVHWPPKYFLSGNGSSRRNISALVIGFVVFPSSLSVDLENNRDTIVLDST